MWPARQKELPTPDLDTWKSHRGQTIKILILLLELDWPSIILKNNSNLYFIYIIDVFKGQAINYNFFSVTLFLSNRLVYLFFNK